MVKIERDGNGFRLKFSVPGQRFSVLAKNIAEIREALIHYYGTDHISEPHIKSRCPVCPTCKEK